MATPLGKRIASAREQKGWSQAELARATGMAQPTIHYLENEGTKTMQMVALAQALGVNAGWLATGKGPRVGGGDIGQHAPAMLAMLKKVVAEFDGYEQDQGMPDGTLKLIRDAKKFIAKVEG